ncbi:MAG: hypothetical protein JOZ72_07785, partial [Alphaproteobacteria bacterium]|nr:hypothetical protein [Alphaproteobacteria bacterium]
YGNAYDPEDTAGHGFERLLSVQNSIGRQIDFTLDGYAITGFTNHLGGTDLRSVSLGDFTGYQTGGFAGSVTDAAGAKTKFAFLPAQVRSDSLRPIPHPRLLQIYTAENLSKPNLQYNYDALGRVKEVVDAETLQKGDRAPWSFLIADGTRGERDDPLGDAWSVTYDTWGHPSRYIDERGTETDTTSDGRGRTLSTVYPEGDCEAFAYDDHGNTTDLWKVDKSSSCNTGAGSSHVLHVSAVWDQTWNKPASVTDANGNTTTLEYFAAGLDGAGEIKKATRPADAGGVHPVYSFTYDDYGKPVDSYVPFQGTQTIRTKNTYESDEDLDTVVVDYGGLALTTSYDYTADGDVKTTTDPRGNVTTRSTTTTAARPRTTITTAVCWRR